MICTLLRGWGGCLDFVSGRHIDYSYSYHPLKLIAIAINNTIKRTRENQTDNPATININFDDTKEVLVYMKIGCYKILKTCLIKKQSVSQLS